MPEEGLFRRRHLPHIDVEDKPYFVTGCLAGSISAVGISKIRRYRNELDSRPKPIEFTTEQWEMQKHKLVFKLVDDLLDGESPSQYLADPRLAEILQNSFLFFAGVRYDLLAFVVMPSHHHWLFLPKRDWADSLADQSTTGQKAMSPRESISHSIQSYTANQCNRFLGRSGTFWQGETFDHYPRDEAELLRIIHYIENNPVKAKLIEHPHEWPWSSAALRHRRNLAPGEPILKVG